MFFLYFLHLPDLDVAAEFSALEEISDEEAVSISVPAAIPPASTSLRDYVDKSETLSKLVQLGSNTLDKLLRINLTKFKLSGTVIFIGL